MNASLIVGLLWSQVLLSAGQSPLKARAKVLIVGVYHFQSKQNLYTQEQDDPFSSRRQQEIGKAVERLKTFGPTKVALEFAYNDPKANERYGKFLNANYSLGPNEAEQLGFRLARDLNLSRVYPIDYRNAWDFDAVKKFARKHGQEKLLSEAESVGKNFTEDLTKILKTGTVLDGLRFINSSEALRLRQSLEMLLVRVGKAENYAGVNLEKDWYERNLRIFANLTRIIESPNDRVLVLYGQGHVPLLRQFVADSPDLELVAADPYLSDATGR